MPTGGEVFDVAIIGAGIVGLTIAHRLSNLGKRVVVIEKESGAGMGVTSGQAGVIHVVQLPFGSLKSRLARKGNIMYDGLCSELGVRLNRMPALLVVRGWLRIPALAVAFLYLRFGLGAKFRTRLMRGSSLRKLEPLLSNDVTGGLVVDGYGTVDAQSLVSVLRSSSERNGAVLKFGCKLASAEVGGSFTTLKTTAGDVRARFVVNAAGLYSDDVSKALSKDLGKVEPGLGVMAVYSDIGLHCIVAPLPLSLGSRTKGGAIIPATDGTTIVGPTLRATTSKEDLTHTTEDLGLLNDKFGPLLKTKGRLVRIYAGIRPLSPTKDFIIDLDREKRMANLVGIESPGLTAAPAIAEMVERMITGTGP